MDIKVALYVHARHEDLKAHDPSITGMLVTNTMFTRDAIAYGECMSMNLMAWNYPKDHTSPITSRSSVSTPDRISQLPPRVVQTMANDGVVLAHHLCDLKPTAGRTYGLSDATFAVLQRDAKTLCDSLASS